MEINTSLENPQEEWEKRVDQVGGHSLLFSSPTAMFVLYGYLPLISLLVIG